MGAEPLLSVDAVDAVYDRAIQVLRGVSLTVPKGGIVALLGANGAGKSTLLKACSNLLRAERGDVTGGRIAFGGRTIAGRPPDALVKDGLIHVLEGRRCFPHLSVEENLLAGAYSRGRDRAGIAADLARVFALFPRLDARRATLAGLVSGGEQQMTALGRALMARPRLILIDEPTLGLAPMLAEEIFATIARLNRDDGTAFLLAEQNVRAALGVADYGYVLETGRVALEGEAARLRDDKGIKALYLGAAPAKP